MTMRTFAQKTKATQLAASATPSTSGAAQLSQSRDTRLIRHLQRAVGNQVVRRMMEVDAEDLKRDGPSTINEVLASQGKPVEPGIYAHTEPRFGYDPGQARSHTGARADGAAGGVQARTVPLGGDVGFGADPYSPNGPEGRHLSAHELPPVMQGASDSVDAGVIQRSGFNPPKTSTLPASPAPWHDIWVGGTGVVFEVVRDGIPVRVFRSYEQLKIKDWRTLVCEHNAWPDPADLRTRMEAAGAAVAAQNPRVIPEVAAAHRVHLVVFGNYETGYYPYKGHGSIILHADFNPGDYKNVVVHELSHGLFEFHRVGSNPGAEQAAPDKVLIGMESLFDELDKTANVPIPTKKFDPKEPPPLKGEGEMKPAGLVMLTDVLWAGSGGHPWDDAHELFASAFAGNLLAPRLLREIVAHYAKADPAIAPLAEKLFTTLASGTSREVGEPTGTHVTPPKEFPVVAQISWAAEPEDMYKPVTERTYCLSENQPDLDF